MIIQEKNQKNWLDHHLVAVPKKGFGSRLSTYMIALEAWRRGLQVTFYLEENDENRTLIRYIISSQTKSYRFNSSLGERVSEEAYHICDHKDRTKLHLDKAGFNTPRGKLLNIEDIEQSLIQSIEDLEFPLVAKPLNANTGKGVSSNIKNQEELIKAISYIKSLGFTKVILEKRIEGTEYRVLVLNNQVLGVVERVPANIIGDGKSTVKELINLKNKSKDENPNLFNRHIEIDSEVKQKLREKNYTIDSVVPKDERVFLRDKVALDGDPIDATDQLSEQVKDVCIKAVESVPGLDLCGLDIIVDKHTNNVTIIEMNTRPMLGLHTFPVKGKPRDVVSPIVDYYFPETINKTKSNLYFNFKSVIAPLIDRSVKEVVLPPIRDNKPYISKRIIVKNLPYKGEFLDEVIARARSLKINGHIRELDHKEWEVIIGSQNKATLNNFIHQIKEELKDTKVLIELEDSWPYSINTGFRLRTIHSRTKSLKNAREELKDLQRKIGQMEKQMEEKIEHLENSCTKLKKEIIGTQNKNKKLKRKLKKSRSSFRNLQEEYNHLDKELKSVLNSKSWKITSPLRKIMNWVHKRKLF